MDKLSKTCIIFYIIWLNKSINFIKICGFPYSKVKTELLLGGTLQRPLWDQLLIFSCFMLKKVQVIFYNYS